MRSRKPSAEILEFRFTEADIRAMNDSRGPWPMTPEVYSRFVTQFHASYEQLRAKQGPCGERFRL